MGQHGLAEFTIAWHDVAVFPARFTLILTVESQLQSLGIAIIRLIGKSQLQSNKHNLFTIIATLQSNIALQSIIAAILAELVILTLVTILQSSIAKVSKLNESGAFGQLLADISLLSDFTIIFAHIACIFTNIAAVLALESKLFGRCFVASFPIDDAKLQSLVTQLYANNSDVQSIESKLFDTALFTLVALLLSIIVKIQPLVTVLQSYIAIAHFTPVSIAESAKLLLTFVALVSCFAGSGLFADIQSQLDKVQPNVACLFANIAGLSRG